MFVFRKIWRALFSWTTGFEIRPFALLPTKYQWIFHSSSRPSLQNHSIFWKIRNSCGDIFFYLSSLLWTFTIHGTARKGEVIFSVLLYHFHLLQNHSDIRRAITAKSSPLHMTLTGIPSFSSASRKPLKNPLNSFL